MRGRNGRHRQLWDADGNRAGRDGSMRALVFSSSGSSDPTLDIERPEELLGYLRAQGVLGPDDRPAMRTFSGGVSNRAVLVEIPPRAPFVVKQALSRLRVAVEWRADPARIHREARALEYLSQLVPSGAVPQLRFEDHRHHLIGMSAVPRPHRNWKELLLEGHLSLDHVGQFATLLGTIHARSSAEPPCTSSATT